MIFVIIDLKQFGNVAVIQGLEDGHLGEQFVMLDFTKC